MHPNIPGHLDYCVHGLEIGDWDDEQNEEYIPINVGKRLKPTIIPMLNNIAKINYSQCSIIHRLRLLRWMTIMQLLNQYTENKRIR